MTTPHVPAAVTETTIGIDVSGELPGTWRHVFFEARHGQARQVLEDGPRSYKLEGVGDMVLMVKALAADGSGEVRALAGDDYRELWQHDLPGGLFNRVPLVSASRVVLPWGLMDDTREGSLVSGVDGLEAQTGRLLWRHTVLIRRGSFLRAAVDDTRVYLGYVKPDHKVGADEPGLEVLCLSAADGHPMWNGSYPSADLLFAAQGRLYGFSGRPESDEGWLLWAAEGATGKVTDEFTHTPGFELASPSRRWPAVLGGSYLVVGEAKRRDMEFGEPTRLRCIDLASGKVAGQWRFVPSANRSWGPLEAGEQVYFREDDSHVVALRKMPGDPSAE
ncbi:MAG: PQQ-binding-like beta-propeller repeat protein [Thermoleophilia bacterium]|nr:PQQ-binding-like beta-propeller repeat protein [Thermoleophilia bacterium]